MNSMPENNGSIIRSPRMDALFVRWAEPGDTTDDCWAWAGTIVNGRAQLLGTPAARYSYTLFNGPIEGGLHVRHTCDNPGCTNPLHLVTGTHTDNMRDMAERGRARNMYTRVLPRNANEFSDEEIFMVGQLVGLCDRKEWCVKRSEVAHALEITANKAVSLLGKLQRLQLALPVKKHWQISKGIKRIEK